MKKLFLISILISSCSVVRTEVKIENHIKDVLTNLKVKNIKTSFSLLIIGEPGFSREFYSETLGDYLAKKGVDVWILTPKEKNSFPTVFSAAVRVITTYTPHDETFVLCHGFSCLPVLESSTHPRIKGIFMISPPLFSWEWSETFKWFVSRYESGRKIEETLDEIPTFVKSQKKTFELLFGERFSKEEIGFIKRNMKPITDDWIEYIKNYIKEEKTDFIEKFCKIEKPSIAVAGQGDGFIPYWTSIPPSLYRKKCKNEFWFFGRANFNKKEYAHLEMFLGEDAKDEIFPYIYRWLKFGWKKTNWMKESAGFPGENQ
mgnify:CR=1 FL=1